MRIRTNYLTIVFFMIGLVVSPVFSQVVDFNEQTEGPWSDVENTTITVPKTANDSVALDGEVSAAEYGGFEGIEVIPGENAWILNYAEEKNWEGPEDASFTFYLTYDDTFFYVGVDAKDDVVISDDEPARFWADDAVELVIGPENNRYDYNTDSTPQDLGGHTYFNYEGQFSEWNLDDTPNFRRWAISTEWSYGEEEEVFGVGQETDTGWVMEAKMHKVMFEDPDYGAEMVPGEIWDFNIGLDDDDGAGLALQYWWASRIRAQGFNPDNEYFDLLTEEEIETRAYLDPDSPAAFWPLNLAQPLSFASGGEIILGEQVDIHNWSLY